MGNKIKIRKIFFWAKDDKRDIHFIRKSYTKFINEEVIGSNPINVL